jgi:prolipoprotein diacylglyceryl transferase
VPPFLHGPLIASIPSPSFNELHLGPLTLRMYGLCIALGVIAAVMISAKRWEKRGGNPDDIGTVALWAVPAGVIGARMYHLATDWKTYRGHWFDMLKITNGGLGIPGGVAAGVLVGLVWVKKRGLPAKRMLDVVAIGIPVAQAIGRFGNYFNQELFGRPTTLPWGLRIDPDKIPAGYLASQTFHPTFAYEAIWNLALAGVLILIDRTKRLRDGELFTLYVLGYAIGRLWVEELRIDHASLIFGVRVNIWMSILAAILAASVFAKNRMFPSDDADLATATDLGGPGTFGADTTEGDAGDEGPARHASSEDDDDLEQPATDAADDDAVDDDAVNGPRQDADADIGDGGSVGV